MIVEQTEAQALQLVADKLAAELAALRAKVNTYYYEELVLRGDRGQIREYKEWFDLK